MEEKRYKIMLVEDDRLDQLAFTRMVEDKELPYDVTTATSIQEAQSTLESGKFDVVISDYSLGDGTAFDILDSVHDETPVILVTGAGDEEVAIKAWKAGAYDYLTKDLERNYLKAVQITIENATKHKMLEQILHRKQRNLEAIFDAAPVGMMLVNEDVVVKRANDVIRQITHKEFSQIINQRIGDALGCTNSSNSKKGCGHSSACKACPLRETIGTVLSSEASVHNVEFQPTFEVENQGITPWFCMSAEPVMIDGNKHVVIAIDDITNRKHAIERAEKTQRELEQLNRQLESSVEQANLMAQEAVIADLTKSQFLANMSHEIRTPMNAIIGFSEVLSEEKLTDEQQHYIDIIRESAENLLALINDILDFSKIEAGKLDTEIIDCSLEQLFAVIESLMRSRAHDKGLKFEITQCQDLPSQIRTDPVRLRQCLVNLINNAIKFTNKGYVHVNISLKTVDDISYIRFDVEDTGIGIPEKKLGVIFDAFTQTDPTTTRKYGGTGLGLAITKQLAQLLGGEVSVKSEVKKGSIFSLTIPTGVDVSSRSLFSTQNIESEAKQQQQQEGGSNDIDIDKYQFTGRVLVAEDSRTNQMLINLLLRRMGLDVTIVDDGKKVINKVDDESFDLILMDIQMPNMNGYEATKALRKKGLATPIIALTAHAMKGDENKCLSAGCDMYLSKPIDRRRLIKILGQYLSSPDRPLSKKIDSVTSEVNELSRLCRHGSGPSGKQADKPGEPEIDEEVINWESLRKICDDEKVIKEITKVFLQDSPKTMKVLTEAVKAKDSTRIQLYAHKLKGAAMTIAAPRLVKHAYRLEYAADQENVIMEDLLNNVEHELKKLARFLSEKNWIKKAKQQAGSKT